MGLLAGPSESNLTVSHLVVAGVPFISADGPSVTKPPATKPPATARYCPRDVRVASASWRPSGGRERNIHHLMP